MAKQREEEGAVEGDQSLAKDEIEADNREGEEAVEDEDGGTVSIAVLFAVS